ncbi:DsrE family protein [Alteromonas sp. ASW11-36]|uniref:DsrE family protein n=1 Tax=Alteromonas arenosi TaxID=3055817 RepID=A0ABT7SXB3_9ALTE|nr:DsrE family protein [Alteromonas sp. ASW11-36]MDM7860806.1 DsrE family protein [Alteromonas sp. ASW11-36]
MANILVVFESGVENYQQALDGLDFIMASTGYGHQASALFLGAGLSLLATPKPENSSKQATAKIIKSFPFYDIDDVFVCSDSLAVFNNSNTVYTDLDITELDSALISDFIARYDHVVRF